jgi:hypothetical protein
MPKAATMRLQGLQEMQASTGSDLSPGFIHPVVVAGKFGGGCFKMKQSSSGFLTAYSGFAVVDK